MWETLEVFDFALYPWRSQWQPALSMIPGSELFQQHYDSLPDEFKSKKTADIKQKVL